MLLKSQPDPLTRLQTLGDVTAHEPAGDQPLKEHPLAKCVSHVSTPQGKKAILKTMLTTACERNCHYCVFRAGRGATRRERFTPDEMAGAYDRLQRSGVVDGLFLSSGIIKGSVTTQDKLIDTAEIIRRKHRNYAYLHLKIMPGVEYDQLYRAMQLADRVSVNLEGPTEERLDQLAPKKDFWNELVRMLEWSARIRAEHPGERLASAVTQFVVGAVGDTDLELLSLSERLYRQFGLKRAYYMAFNPVIETPFENLPAENPLRQFRLYQSSFLLRDYNWDVEDLPFAPTGNLPLDLDPKAAWADAHLRHAPLEIMTASRDDLLRVPGIGPKTADAILRARRQGRLRELNHLRALGLRAPEKAAPYLTLDGQAAAVQLRLF